MARCIASFFETFSCASTASAIWSPTRITGFNAVMGSWKIMAIFSPRSFRTSSSGEASMLQPAKSTSPSMQACGGSRRINASAVADLPEPDSPTSASDSLSRMENETSRTAVSRLPPVAGNAIFNWRTSSSTPLILFGNWVICNLVIESGKRKTARLASPHSQLPDHQIPQSHNFLLRAAAHDQRQSVLAVADDHDLRVRAVGKFFRRFDALPRQQLGADACRHRA